MMATDVQNSSISVKMCDEIKTVFFSSASRRRMFFKSIRPWGSTPLAGSSSNRTRGSGNQRLGQHQSLRIPRDNSTTSVSRFSLRPTISRNRPTSSGRRWRGIR